MPPARRSASPRCLGHDGLLSAVARRRRAAAVRRRSPSRGGERDALPRAARTGRCRAGSPSRSRSAPGSAARPRSRPSRPTGRRARSRPARRGRAARCARRCPAALPAEVTPLRVAVGDEPEHERVHRVDVRAERAGEADPVDTVDAVALHQQAAARVERGLGELDLPDVVLRDRAAPARPRRGRTRTSGRPATTRGVRAASAPSIVPVGREHPREVELGDDLDDARAADAGDRGSPRSPGSSDQASQPIDLDAGLERLAGRCEPARSRPARRAGRSEICAPSNAGPVGLDAASRRSRLPSTISAFVPTSTMRLTSSREVRRLGEDHAGGVGADVAGDARQDVCARSRVDRQAELARRGAGAPRRRRARTARRRARSGRCRGAGDA